MLKFILLSAVLGRLWFICCAASVRFLPVSGLAEAWTVAAGMPGSIVPDKMAAPATAAARLRNFF